MAFVRFNERNGLLGKDGNPLYIVGINYVAKYICTNFWEDWRPDEIEKDLAYISGLGLNAVRIPMFWGYMEPEEGRYNNEIFEKFNIFLNWCEKYGLYVMPWFLVGIATRHYDVPFRNGRPFFTGDMVDIAANHLKHFIKEYKDAEQILFWDICDEPEWYSTLGIGVEKLPLDGKVLAKWVKTMYDAIKSVDTNHLVTLGFGGAATDNYGYHLPDMAEILDFMAVTCYPNVATESLATYRNNFYVTYHVKANTLFGKPVFICEAPGHSSIVYSEEAIGHYFKVSMYSGLINGSTGVMPWVFNDFEESTWYDIPLNKSILEPGFGIVTTDGRLKKSGEELRDFAKFVKAIDAANYKPCKAEAAILLPEGYHCEPGTAPGFTVKMIYTSFILAKGCSADVDLLWYNEDFSPYKLIIVSAPSRLTHSTLKKIENFVENGGTVYYNGGLFSMGASFNKLFGVEVQSPEKDFGYDTLYAKQSFGCIENGCQVKLAPQFTKYLRVKPVSAQVICDFEEGIPALLVNKFGKGRVYLTTKSFEDGLLEMKYDDFIHNGIFDIYDALFNDANINRDVKCDDNRIEVGRMVNQKTNENLIICVNHDIAKVETLISFNGLPANSSIFNVLTKHRVHAAQGGDTQVNAIFEPAGVNVYRIEA